MIHDFRSIVVALRATEQTLYVTTLNDLDADKPFFMTVELNDGMPFTASGLTPDQIPDVGRVTTIVQDEPADTKEQQQS